ncbi:MAG: DEAD/DEAH box helicase [Pirellulales bacterium]
MDADLFHPLIRGWFAERFGEPTSPQLQGWPAIAAGTPTLIAAPTGSGKTLAAFLVCLDRLYRRWLAGELADETQVVYVSPLKALSNDIHRNLEVPLAEICERSVAAGLGRPEIRTAVRTGDTPARERQQMLRRPPHILVTTPESLYLLVTAEKAREKLRGTRTVIVDEIHALARDKRGSHLALTLERLAALCPQPPVRIGLSATQRPIDQIAAFLCGTAGNTAAPSEACRVIDVGHARELDLGLVLPASELAAVCSGEQWGEVYEQLTQLIQSHRSTLVFVNTRRMAERIAHRLTELLGADAVASHHGSLSRELRLDAEQRLKSGELRALVATASLEMGIDVGYIDLVCQIGSPRAISTFLQRVGRSGHSLRAIPQGRLFPLTRDELLECLALLRAVRQGVLDAVEIPVAPLDILAQQVIAAVACDEWTEDGLYDLVRRAWPYRDLPRDDFDAVLQMVSEGLTPRVKQGAFIHRDRLAGKLRPRRGARLAALTSGGAIPEAPLYRVVAEPEGTYVGEVDEHFAVDSSAGDVFLLGTTSWRITAIRGQEVRVRDAGGAPPTVPFWFGEAPGRTRELSEQLAEVRWEIGQRCQAVPEEHDPRSGEARAGEWLRSECGADEVAAAQAVRYVAAQIAALGMVPTTRDVVFERFFDEAGGMQLVIHAPFGHRVNRAWGLALRKRFCRSFDFELQAAATDNGILLSMGPQHSFPIEQLFKMLGPHNGQELLQQALFAVPLFPVRWRWNATRALVVLRFQQGRKIPFFLQRFRADDLLAATFPATVGCLENHHGDIEIPDHPLVRQTVDDCLQEALDTRGWLQILAAFQQGTVRFIPCDTREPSPFSHELLNANPYAFLDGADLEERRTRAVTTRRTLSTDDFRDLSRLDPEAVRQVVAEAAPVVRSADELHDVLLQAVMLPEPPDVAWYAWFDELMRRGRAARLALPSLDQEAGTASPPRYGWLAAERWPLVRAVYGADGVTPAITLPAALDSEWTRSDAWVELVRGQLLGSGPVTAAALAQRLGLDPAVIHSALEALEGQGMVLRGHFSRLSDGTAGSSGRALASSTHAGHETAAREDAAREGAAEEACQWCDRRLLARIHRLTLDGLRRRIQPVSPADYHRFLTKHQRWGGGYGAGPAGVREALAQLAGLELPAAAWERHVLAPRVAHYDPQWLDQLFLAGEMTWGRLRPPRRPPRDESVLAAMTRAMPVAIVPRDDLVWQLPPERPEVDTGERAGPQSVLAALRQRGALFLNELRHVTGLSVEDTQAALRELASLGRVTSDAFAAVRSIVTRREGGPLRISPVGRWSLFPGWLIEEAAGGAAESSARTRQAARLERWCWLLLKRYGVVFRDLLAREPAAPPWSELAPVYRRLELRGEIRGGRFVAGVAGEQFASESSVVQLRAVRDEPVGDWIVVSAADPLNLSGIVVPGPRIPATHRNLVVFWGGRCVAARRGGEVLILVDDLDQATQVRLRDALTHPRRRPGHSVGTSSVMTAPAVAPPTVTPSAVPTTAPLPPAIRPSPGTVTSSPVGQEMAEPSPAVPPPPHLDVPGGTRPREDKVTQIRRRWTQF